MKKLLLVICAMLSLNIAMAQKNVLVEEVTGTWCNNCPSGIYYIDSLQHVYDNVIAIAVHTNGNPKVNGGVADIWYTATDLDEEGCYSFSFKVKPDKENSEDEQ